MDEREQLAERAFRIFHDLNLEGVSAEEKRINRMIAYCSIVKDADRLCEHGMVGVMLLVKRLLELQHAERHERVMQ